MQRPHGNGVVERVHGRGLADTLAFRWSPSLCMGCLPFFPSCRAGTTRDSVPIMWEFNGQKIVLVDTAGTRAGERHCVGGVGLGGAGGGWVGGQVEDCWNVFVSRLRMPALHWRHRPVPAVPLTLWGLLLTPGIKRLARWDPGSVVESVATSSATKVGCGPSCIGAAVLRNAAPVAVFVKAIAAVAIACCCVLLVQSLGRADVVALVMDGKEPLTKQDLALAQKAVDDGKAVVVVLNKMDIVGDKKLLVDGVAQRLLSAIWQAQGVECVPVCAMNGEGVEDVMPAVCVCGDKVWYPLFCSPPALSYLLPVSHMPAPALYRRSHTLAVWLLLPPPPRKTSAGCGRTPIGPPESPPAP
jgi:hypothetical protein